MNRNGTRRVRASGGGSSTNQKWLASAASDWYVITGSSKSLLETEVKPLVEQFLHERGLELSQEKTTITHIADGFDFLGQHIRDYDDTILVKPSRKNVQTFLRNVRGVIKGNAQATTGNLIGQLNPIIRGWANFHRHVVSKQTYTRVDNAIFHALWQWTKRRHPKKPRRWIKDTYFHPIGGRHWVFSGERPGKDGHPRNVRLFYASQVAIQRHVKIRGAANPYDPAWELYFEHRLGVKMVENLRERRTLLALWKAQGGVCLVCEQPITTLTGWHNHHIVWRTHGGTDRTDNRVLLHPNCHTQVHHAGLTVGKPRPSQGV